MDSLSRHRFFVFFFNDTATTEIYTLSLHDALPIYPAPHNRRDLDGRGLAVELVNPSEGELVHILTVDLTQGAVAGRPVRAGVGEPVLGRLACRRKLIV